ncbi:MAG: hypothetical protein R3E79_29565 [Caldilineaceae bacterium]
MKERLQQRLTELRREFDAGQKMLADLEAKQTELRETLLRISGAIQVLEEELATANQPPVNGTGEKPEAQGQLA